MVRLALRADRVRSVGAVDRLGHRPGWIKTAQFVRQHFRCRDAVRGDLLRNLVADAPDDHTRMVAVATHHRRQVLPPPALEIGGVVIWVLGRLPSVESLFHDQHAELVACVEHGRRGRVVRGPYGIEAAGLQQLDLALFRAIDRGCAKQAVVVMHAAAAQLVWLAVDPQPLKRIDLDLAYAERGGHAIKALVGQVEQAFHGVELGAFRRPEARFGEIEIRIGLRRSRATVLGDDLSGRVADPGGEHCARNRTADAGDDADSGLCRRDRLRANDQPPPLKIRGAGDVQSNVAVDAGSRVPAAVAAKVGHTHSEEVLAGGIKVWLQVEAERRVAVRPLAQHDAVQPDLGIHVDAVEFDLHARVLRQRRQAEALPVPADTPDGKRSGSAAGARRGEHVIVCLGSERADLTRRFRHRLPHWSGVNVAEDGVQLQVAIG